MLFNASIGTYHFFGPWVISGGRGGENSQSGAGYMYNIYEITFSLQLLSIDIIERQTD